MASDNKEIEIKVKVSEQEFRHVYELLKGCADYAGKTEQHDSYFSPEQDSYVAEKYPFKWLSIRTRGGKHILNYKHFYPEGKEKHDYCDEYETELSDPESMRKILSELGIVHLVTVKKTRHKFIYENSFEIALDSVEGLGFFVEIESIMKNVDISAVREKILSLAKKLGLKAENIDYRGYPYELMKKKGLI